jgi:hypothetical protein
MQRHSFDFVSFVLGAVVLSVGIIFVSGVHGATWVGPIVLIGIGVALFAAALQRVLTKPENSDQ